MHPEDSGVHHYGPSIDTWQPRCGDEVHDEAINVRIEGFRHDSGDDWPDTIYATNVAPGFLSEISLQAADARRLGEALILAADLAEGVNR